MTDTIHVVRSEYPAAEPRFNPPDPGADAGRERNGYWAVYNGHFLESEELGAGPTEEDAWLDAAARIGATVGA
jgi:hypothetical protein